MAKTKIPQPTEEVDMTPMIDVIFLLIIFFILAGKITSDLKSEKITVPPTKTAEKMENERGWGIIVVDVFGATQSAKTDAGLTNTIKVGENMWRNSGLDDYSGYQNLRALLDTEYAIADKYPDPLGTGLILPKVILEIRADADTEYRLVQEIQQVASDTVDPNNKMLPVTPKSVEEMVKNAKPFVNIRFTTRSPDDKK